MANVQLANNAHLTDTLKVVSGKTIKSEVPLEGFHKIKLSPKVDGSIAKTRGEFLKVLDAKKVTVETPTVAVSTPAEKKAPAVPVAPLPAEADKPKDVAPVAAPASMPELPKNDFVPLQNSVPNNTVEKKEETPVKPEVKPNNVVHAAPIAPVQPVKDETQKAPEMAAPISSKPAVPAQPVVKVDQDVALAAAREKMNHNQQPELKASNAEHVEPIAPVQPVKDETPKAPEMAAPSSPKPVVPTQPAAPSVGAPVMPAVNGLQNVTIQKATPVQPAQPVDTQALVSQKAKEATEAATNVKNDFEKIKDADQIKNMIAEITNEALEAAIAELETSAETAKGKSGDFEAASAKRKEALDKLTTSSGKLKGEEDTHRTLVQERGVLFGRIQGAKEELASAMDILNKQIDEAEKNTVEYTEREAEISKEYNTLKKENDDTRRVIEKGQNIEKAIKGLKVFGQAEQEQEEVEATVAPVRRVA